MCEEKEERERERERGGERDGESKSVREGESWGRVNAERRQQRMEGESRGKL